ncbi:MAG TPA: hypothetical protein PKE31_10270 [Pseudomonadota bacterium]|jgi:tetratricopeptide (TPR) repeat protein|nr:hypothetical protein [Pseudomonadota bacterium]
MSTTINACVAVGFLLLTQDTSRAEDDRPLVPPTQFQCETDACKQAASYLALGANREALEAYESIIEAVSNHRKSLLYFLVATLQLRLGRAEDANRSLDKYRAYIQKTRIPDKELAEGQHRADVETLQQQINPVLLSSPDTATKRSSASASAPASPSWRSTLGMAGMVVGTLGMIGGSTLVGYFGTCYDPASRSCGVPVLNQFIGLSLVVGSTAAIVGGGVLFWLPSSRR